MSIVYSFSRRQQEEGQVGDGDEIKTGYTGRNTDRPADRQTSRHRDKQAVIYTDRQEVTQIDRKTENDKGSGRETETKRDRQTLKALELGTNVW